MPNQHTTEDVMAASRRIVAALDPALSVWEATIRADERAKVRAELLAIAAESRKQADTIQMRVEISGHGDPMFGYWRWSEHALTEAADRIAPSLSAAAVAAAILTPDADA